MKQTSETETSKTRGRVHPFFWDLALTSATQLFVLAAGVVIVSIFGRLMGAVALGEYLLLRRVVSWLQSGSQLGMGVALPRYVAMSSPRRGDATRQVYFLSATICMGVVAGIIFAILLLARVQLARVFFGNPQMWNLMLPLALLILVLTIHVAVYGYYRGCLWMGRANALEIVNLAVAPILSVVLLYRTHSVALIVDVMGVSMSAAGISFAIPLLPQFLHLRLSRIVPFVRELLRYGIARVPGEFAAAGLFALGPVIASHYRPLSQVSQLLLGVSLLTAVSVSVTPLGTVLLSKVSMMLAGNRIEEVRIRLEQLVAAVLELSVFGCLQAVVFCDVLVRVWVGPRYLVGLGIIQVTLLSIPFYLFYVAIRSAIDAASVVAHNAQNGYVALGAFLVLAFLAVKTAPAEFLLHGIAAALLASMAVLAWRTTKVARHLFDLRMPWRECLLPFALALVLGTASYLIDRWLFGRIGITGLIGIEVFMTTVFLLGSVASGSTWLISFWKLLVARNLQQAQGNI